MDGEFNDDFELPQLHQNDQNWNLQVQDWDAEFLTPDADEGFIDDHDMDPFEIIKTEVFTSDEYQQLKKAKSDEKNKFFFLLKMLFFNIDKFDFGFVDFELYREDILSKYETAKSFRESFPYEVAGLDFIVPALILDEDMNNDIELVYSNLYESIFPE